MAIPPPPQTPPEEQRNGQTAAAEIRVGQRIVKALGAAQSNDVMITVRPFAMPNQCEAGRFPVEAEESA